MRCSYLSGKDEQLILRDAGVVFVLKMETRMEEEREPQQRKLAAELNQLKQSCSLVEVYI